MAMNRTSQHQAKIDILLEHRKVMISYLRHKMQLEDWHGVQDAGSDLREIDTELRVLRDLSDV